jgi:hypothetical protein
MADKLCLRVCHNLAQEVAAILKDEGLDEIEMTTLPARCHGPSLPAKPETGEESAACGKPDDCRICVIGCNYLKGLSLPPGKAQPGVWAMNQCFEMLIGRHYTEHLIREGAYLLTPGWLSHWRGYINRWGFDPQTAREFFAESATRLVLLDTGVDPRSAGHLRDFAEFVARPAQTIPVGLSCFRLHLLNLLLEERLAEAADSAKSELAEAKRKLGDYAMVYDVLGRLTAMDSEARVIESVFDLFTMLFAPAQLIYVSLAEGGRGMVRSIPASASEDPFAINRLVELKEEYARTESSRGFILRIGGPGEMIGVLEVEGIAFPQYQEHYLNLALSLAKVCGLAIRNARTYEKLDRNVVELREALANVKTLSGLLPICAWCKKIRNDEGYWSKIESFISEHSEARFSHGVCPECLNKHFGAHPDQPPPAGKTP